MSKTITKRMLAEARKRSIMNSYAYQVWHENRMQNPNPPRNPYKAYMIDRALKARLKEKEKWKRQVNKADIESSDYPVESWRRSRTYRPHRRPTYQPRPTTPIFIPQIPTNEREAARKEYERIANIISQKYNFPKPNIEVTSKSFIGARMRGDNWIVSSGGRGIANPLGGIPAIEIGSKGFHKIPDLLVGTFAHEMGHLGHYGTLLQTEGSLDIGAATGKNPEQKLVREISANMLKKQFLEDVGQKETPRMKWARRYAIGTYYRQWGQTTKGQFLPRQKMKELGYDVINPRSIKVPDIKLGGKTLKDYRKFF